MISVLFLGCVYSETQKDLFLKKSHRGYQFAAQNLQESLIEGFVANETDFTVLTIPSLSTFPRGYRSPIVKDDDFIFNGKVLGKSLGYLNIPFKNHVDYSVAAEYIDRWYDKTEGKHVIIVYALLGQQMGIALAAKRRHQDVKLCVIVPDLPRFMGCNKYYKMLGLQEKAINSIYARIQKFDGLVALAEPMVADLGMSDKPYTVMEGIFSGVDEHVNVEKDPHKVILYTGNIGSRYGISRLMDAFSMIKNEDFRLWIRGTGDNSEVLQRMKNDNRIRYIGKLSKPDLIRLQKQATLLVNPVSPSEEFTRFFFPSKTMDYLASGTPTVMYHLDCLPPEYDDHLYFFDEDTTEGMAKKLESICVRDAVEMNSKGQKAAKFILEQKNAKIQVGKIIELFNRI